MWVGVHGFVQRLLHKRLLNRGSARNLS
jgi:hypothetical protein